MRASVVFPQPDSPTIPNVSPRSSEKLTPSTAIERRPGCTKTPVDIGYDFRRSRASSSSSLGISDFLGGGEKNRID
jgi:hypothetical protein